MPHDPLTLVAVAAYGLTFSDHGRTHECNWQVCIAASDPSSEGAPSCLIKLVPRGPWWFATGAQMSERSFGDATNNPPVKTDGLAGPFHFTSVEEAIATYTLLGGYLPPAR